MRPIEIGINYSYCRDMSEFFLTDDQLTELRHCHRRERNRKVAYKINAIILLGTGWALKDVESALLISDDTLRSYLDKYKSGGIAKLTQTDHKGSASFLSEDQQKALIQELEREIYLTTHSIVAYVKEAFSVDYSVSGMRDLLHRLGYEYKKPKLIPGNPDREAQEDFAGYYEQFMASKPANEEVLFLDAVHPEHNTMAAYGWIKKGQDRKLQTNSGRQRLNLHGAINIETLSMTVIESKTVNADSTIELLEVINQKYALSERIHIVLDNARYHYSKEVKVYLKNNGRINLVFIPPYSPELNLVERVWRFFKSKVLYNKYYPTIGAFREASIDFFKNIGSYKNELKSLLGGGFENIA